MRELLPTFIEINNDRYELRTDYRYGLTVMQAFEDDNLTDSEKAFIAVKILFKDIPQDIPFDKLYEKAVWFLDCGMDAEGDCEKVKPTAPLYSWKQDEQMIFSAINKVAGKEIRTIDYMHWWTFIGLFNEIGEGAFSTVVSIRNKRHKHKKLEKWELDFYREHKSIIELNRHKEHRTEEEKEAINKALGV